MYLPKSFHLHQITRFLLLLLLPLPSHTVADSLCPDSCGNIPIHFPFGLRDGCGARQFRGILNCTAASAAAPTISSAAAQLFLQTPSGSYVVRSIDYPGSTVVIYDPFMSTCSGGNNNAVQPRADFALSDSQYMTIVPSPDTFFALLNCSSDSPLLHRLSRVCATSLSGHACDELYSCPSFEDLRGSAASAAADISNFTTSPLGNGSVGGGGVSPAAPPPPCCFTRYDTLKYTTMEILDCSHYAFVYGMDKVKGIAPADWSYGIKLSYRVPDSGCGGCEASGGACGFDADTGGALCMCSSTLNSTTTCGSGGDFSSRGTESHKRPSLVHGSVVALGAILYMIFTR